MVSRQYRSFLFLYEDDKGTQSLKQQNWEINPTTGNTFIPLTPLLQARIVATTRQYEITNTKLRHLNLLIDEREFTVLIPYAPNNTIQLKACIQEILGSESVATGYYVGESKLNGNKPNNNL